MRGKGYVGGMISGALGITPAYAGKSGCKPDALTRCRDHPRVCGEKNKAVTLYALDLGSPPRMRGKD